MVKGGSRSRFTENKTVLSQFTKNKDIKENHGSWRIKHLFLVSQKIILQNHTSQLLWKSRFTRKKLAISHFTGKKKGLITSHKNTLYHPQVITFVFCHVCFVSQILHHNSSPGSLAFFHLGNRAEISHMNPRRKLVLVTRPAAHSTGLM